MGWRTAPAFFGVTLVKSATNTMTANLPAQMLYAAAQFAHTDVWKYRLTGIHVKPAESGSGITITSTDGHRLFQVNCPDPAWHCQVPLLLNAKAFKKRIPYSRLVAIDNKQETANIFGGKGPQAELLQAIPWQWKMQGVVTDDPALDYPSYERLWPSEYGENTETPIKFDPTLMADFLKIAASYSSAVTMQRNAAHQPFTLSAIIQDTNLEDVEMRFLLMPVGLVPARKPDKAKK